MIRNIVWENRMGLVYRFLPVNIKKKKVGNETGFSTTLLKEAGKPGTATAFVWKFRNTTVQLPYKNMLCSTNNSDRVVILVRSPCRTRGLILIG